MILQQSDMTNCMSHLTTCNLLELHSIRCTTDTSIIMKSWKQSLFDLQMKHLHHLTRRNRCSYRNKSLKYKLASLLGRRPRSRTDNYAQSPGIVVVIKLSDFCADCQQVCLLSKQINRNKKFPDSIVLRQSPEDSGGWKELTSKRQEEEGVIKQKPRQIESREGGLKECAGIYLCFRSTTDTTPHRRYQHRIGVICI